MKKSLLVFSMGLVVCCVFSTCSSNKTKQVTGDENIVSLESDGTLLLKLEEAARYNDHNDPSGSTAEWVFVVPDAGRYKVWLSSATTDTVRLNYTSTVKINFLDNRLEKIPECDKIVRDCKDVSYPYFRTDSYMGSLYFPEPGKYNLQVISEKVASVATGEAPSQAQDTRLMSLILEPAYR